MKLRNSLAFCCVHRISHHHQINTCHKSQNLFFTIQPMSDVDGNNFIQNARKSSLMKSWILWASNDSHKISQIYIRAVFGNGIDNHIIIRSIHFQSLFRSVRAGGKWEKFLILKIREIMYGRKSLWGKFIDLFYDRSSLSAINFEIGFSSNNHRRHQRDTRDHAEVSAHERIFK